MTLETECLPPLWQHLFTADPVSYMARLAFTRDKGPVLVSGHRKGKEEDQSWWHTKQTSGKVGLRQNGTPLDPRWPSEWGS